MAFNLTGYIYIVLNNFATAGNGMSEKHSRGSNLCVCVLEVNQEMNHVVAGNCNQEVAVLFSDHTYFLVVNSLNDQAMFTYNHTAVNIHTVIASN